MDAQNAAGPDKTKPAAAAASEPTKRPDHDLDQNRSSSSSTSAKPPATASKPSPNADKDVKPNANSSADAGDDRSVADAASSDAETIVLPGKDGHSPSKVRKVKHENRSDDDIPATARKSRDHDRDHGNDHGGQRDHRDKEKDKDGSHKDGPHGREKERERERSATTGASASASNSAAPSPSLKKKRLPDKLSENKPSLPAPGQRNKDISASTPTSPPPKRRRSTDANPRQSQADSDSDNARHRSPKAFKDRAKSSDKVIPHKRKAPKVESEDEEEQRKARRQRTAPASTGPSGGDSHSTPHSHAHAHPSKHARDQQKSSRPHDQATARGRSVSPQPRPHRRSASTQLPAQSITGLSQKKKRVPAPLQSTDYHSDESSASGSPHPRSSKLRSLATPATADSTISPAKMAPHKKHLDAHGQTFLARACARGEYEQAKQRLTERPDDLNVADYAGNTPLQIAAINGCEDIVKLLIDAGCNLDCVNYDKDTPLLDAVDNGHLGVIKLLLDAGVNPRKANVNGEEPIDRVNDDMDNADEIRAILKEARQRIGDRRRTSEEHHTERADSRPSHGPESPRRSPVATSHGAAASGRRSTNMRATKTSNHLLYMPMDDKTLRQAAGRGDEETVTRILQVRDGCDDPEAMVNAARGGHDLVMQLLLALGGANPDPPPVPNVAPDVATPMLAAIGQENIKVIQLLLDQSNFDPTRRFKGDTYYEIARRRAGPNWKEEEHILQKAYDEYKKSRSKESSKKSPSRREREKEREAEREHKRANRNEAREESARSAKRNHAASPSRDAPEPKKKTTSSSKAVLSPKEKKRSEPSTRHDDHHTSPKRGPGRPKKDDRVPSIAVSDRENSPAVHKQTKAKRTESDLAAISSEGETAKPRRKLISKGELRSEREKQRRTSQVSTGSSMKDPASPQDSRTDDHPEKEKLKGEKYHDRTKAIKRDESKDRLSVSGENNSKRHRSSATPPHSVSGDKDDSEVPTKRRRLDVDSKERRPKLSSSATEDRPAKSNLSREQSLARSVKSAKASAIKARDDDDRKEPKPKKSSESNRRESNKSTSSEKSIHVKYEDADVDMADAPPLARGNEAEAKSKDNHQHHSQEKKRSADDADVTTSKEEKKRGDAEEKEKEKEKERERRKKREEEEAKRLEEEAKRKEVEERKRQKEEEEKKRRAEEEKERKRKEEEEQKRKEEEEEKKRKEAEEKKRKEEEERKKREEEEERKRKEEEERLRREEEKRKKREEEEKKRLEEEERKRKEEEAKKRREEEERRRKEEEERERKEEEERKKREEEERLQREQIEREAAEAARRKREEEERREREHRERQRAAREAEIRRQREEQERIRLAKLPPLLRWLDTCPNPKTTDAAEKFKHMQGIRYDTIRPETTGTADGREQWVLNTQVALLLGEKDLALSRYTAWEKIPVSSLAKKAIWRLESNRYALISESMFDLGLQLSNYYGEGVDPCRMSYKVIERLRGEAWDKFLKLDMFFVKLSDLMYIVPTIPHLRGIKLSVEYRELPENEGQLFGWKVSQKWKQDPNPDRFYGFAPRNKYYINGTLVDEERPGLSATSSQPFPERRVPRRNGFQQVFPDDPEYARLCKEQGLEHLLEDESRGAPMTNGVQTNGPVSAAGAQVPNGTTHSAPSSAAAGSSPTTVASSRNLHSPQQHYRPLVNGINGTSN